MPPLKVNFFHVFFQLLVDNGHLLGLVIWRIGFSLGCIHLFLALAGCGRISDEAWYSTSLDREEVLSGFSDADVHVFVCCVVKSFDTFDRGVHDFVLGRLGLPIWFRRTYFSYHASVRLRFKWCRALEAILGVEPQLYADILKCVSGSSAVLLGAARFTNFYIGLVGQEAAPKKCVLLSTVKKVRSDMKNWSVSDAGDKWSFKLDVRDLGGHLDATRRARAAIPGRVSGWRRAAAAFGIVFCILGFRSWTMVRRRCGSFWDLDRSWWFLRACP